MTTATKTATAKTKVYQLRNAEDIKTYLQAIIDKPDLADTHTFDVFLKTGKTAVRSGSDYLVHDAEKYLYRHHKGVFYGIGWDSNFGIGDLTRSNPRDCTPAGALVTYKGKPYVVCNADDGAAAPQAFVGKDMGAMLSFTCLGRFFVKAGSKVSPAHQAATHFVSGRCLLVDLTPDTQISIDKATQTKLRADGKLQKTLPRPQAGFTLLSRGIFEREFYWHRSGSCLVFDTELKRSYLLGQDESTYFGVELADNPKTVVAAFTSLIPKAARGTKYLRQGEWFLVPCKETDVPAAKDCAVQFNDPTYEDSIILPLETPDSNPHKVGCSAGRVGPDAVLYLRDACLEHSQHETLDATGWHAVYKNTALRSFSEEGVD